MKALDAGAVESHVMGCPPGAERLAAGCQLPDEVRQRPVVRVAPGLGPEHRDRVLGMALPVEVEPRGAGVEEDKPGSVGRPGGAVEYRREECLSQPVRREDIHAPVAHVRRCRDHRIEDALHARADLLPGRAWARSQGGVPRFREVEQVRALGLIQAERPGKSLEHALGGAARVPPFQPGVVVDADPREHRDLFPAQAGDAPVAAVSGQASLLRSDPGPPRGEEVAHLAAVVHAS